MDFRTGELLTAAQCESGVYIWTIKNPLYFKITKHHERPFNTNHDIITIQIQFNHNLRKALGIHQVSICQVPTRLQPQTWRFLRVFRVQCMKYLDNLGVISINNVIRACNHVLWDVLENTEYVRHSNIIKFNIY
uniref:Replication enhancer n=1 Tax=Ageratum yellow vein China virus TaxID=202567 RepID=A0A145WG85_9GEMI|nr:AC3 protein [Ageratum yellow vein China virus]